MKRKTVLIAILLGNMTFALQVMQSVSQETKVAREAAQIVEAPKHLLLAAAPPATAMLPSPSFDLLRNLVAASMAKHLSSASSAAAPFLADLTVAPPAPPPPDPLSALERPDIDPHYRALARKVLSLLPVDCQLRLRSFFLLHDATKSRGYAGEGVIMVQALPDAEFVAVLTHEALGHFWDINELRGTAGSPPSAFTDGGSPVASDDPSVGFYAISWLDNATRKKAAQRADFVSGYAYKGGPFEDLAESVTYYVLQQDAFRARAKTNKTLAAKLQWLDAHFPKTAIAAKGSPWDGTIAWDATKLPYTWVN